LGSTAPAILPTPANSVVRHLAVQGGKDALLRLINLDNLSGQGAPGHTDGEISQPIGVPQGMDASWDNQHRQPRTSRQLRRTGRRHVSHHWG